MRTFKEHILEKLKVTSNNSEYENEYEKPTYQEYYDLLAKYCTLKGKKFLDVGLMFDFNSDSLPKYKNDQSKSIYKIIPVDFNSPVIRIMTYDFTLKKIFSYNIYVREAIKDKEVDFMEDEYVEVLVKYMKGYIKQYEKI